MRFLFLSLLIFSVQLASAQYNYSVKQILEDDSDYMAVGQNDIFIAKSYKDEVQVYSINEDGDWEYKQTLTPSDKTSDHNTYWYYGSTLAIDGDNAIIAAQYKAPIENEDGGLYFYHKGEDGFWTEEFVFDNPSVVGDTRSYSYYGGKNITMHGNKATASHNNGYPPFVHIFERQNSGEWEIKDTITDPEFLGIDGIDPYFEDSLFITMVYKYKNQRVKEYSLQENGDWLNTNTLSSGITDQNTYFGQSLAVDDTQMVVGYYNMRVETDDDTLYSAGGALIYEKVNSKWQIQDTLYFDSLYNSTLFGKGVAIKDDILVVGATGAKNNTDKTGAIIIYKKDEGTWEKIKTIYPETGVKSFGNKIKFIGDQIAVSSSHGIFIIENLKDCEDVIGGSAKLNSCGVCYGGTTGIDSLTSEESCIPLVTKTTDKNSVVSLHPNPVKSQLQVSLPLNSTAFMVDVLGNHVIEEIHSGSNDLSGLKAGAYFLVVELESGSETHKLMKE